MSQGTQAAAQPPIAGAAATADKAQPNIFNPAYVARIGATALQLGLVIEIVRWFQLENKAFLYLLALTAAGFVVHAFLPARFRMPFFALLSVAGIGVVMGPKNAAWLVALGMMLIGIAHIPINFRLRVALMLVVGGVLAVLRTGKVVEPWWSSVVWPVLGSMFMFRMTIYMYDLRNKSAPFSIWRAMSYFFFLPNVCFTLFPVVDYQTMSRTYYNTDETSIYESGVVWIFRGVVQVLLYRLIYQNFVVDPTAITNAGDVWLYIITNFGMYLKVVGSFSIIIGMVRLFGFALPLTNNNFMLGSSYTNYWRRANIYWKDYILKLFFQPAYVKLNRKQGAVMSMLLATLYAFGFTWLLHSYQFFWIRSDDFPIKWQDIAMWSWLGICLFITMVYEQKYPKKKTLKKPKRTLKGDVILGLKIIGITGSMASMWVLVWISPNWGVTVTMLKALTNWDLHSVVFFFGSLLIFGVCAVLWTYLPSENQDVAQVAKAGKMTPKAFWVSGAVVAAGALAIILIGHQPTVFSPVSEKLVTVADNLHLNKLSTADAALLKQGYYEDLSDATRFSQELAELYAAKPKNWDVNPLVVQYDGYPDFGLKPSETCTFKGATFTTNQWSMRDRAYEKAKPAGTYRFVLMGQSVEQGSGVGDGQEYENITENRLNAEHKGDKKYEILNFANGGYGPLHKLAHFQKTALEFQPDALLWVDITDGEWTRNEIASSYKHKLGPGMIPYPEVQAIEAKAGLEPGMAEVTVRTKIEPYAGEVVKFAYTKAVQVAKEHNIRPLFVILAQPETEPELAAIQEREVAMAKEAGFEIVDLRDVYAGKEVKQFWLAGFDHHPNVEAHKIIAAKLYEKLVAAGL